MLKKLFADMGAEKIRRLQSTCSELLNQDKYKLQFFDQ